MKGSRQALMVAFVGVGSLAFLSAEAQRATGSFQRSVTVDRLREVVVTTGSGDIDVRKGEAGRVEVSGRIVVGRGWGRSKDDAEALVSRIEHDPPIELSGDRLVVGETDDEEEWHNVSISYRIVVPPGASLEAHAGSGGVTVAGLDGSAEAVTGSGDIELADIGGSVEARAGSGSIRVQRAGAPFRARTGSGSISAERIASGEVDVASGSGDIELSGIDGGLQARTGSGDIRVSGAPSGPWNVTAGSGGVGLDLSAGAGFDLDAHTGSGSLTVDRPVTIDGRVERGRLNGRVGGGGPLVRVRTGSGDVRIR